MKKESFLNVSYRFFDIFILSFLVFDFGYITSESNRLPKLIGLIILSIILLIFNIIKCVFYKNTDKKKIALRNTIIISALLFLSVIVAYVNRHLSVFQILALVKPILEVGLLFYFILRLMSLVRYIYGIYYNPAIMFVGSFVIIALAGSFLLMLPSATVNGISYTNALFTATSAVCVTGLTVVETASHFTIVGQTIIIILIQLGGLGILTFTSFFGFFFKGTSSFKEGLNVKDFIAIDSLNDVLKTAMGIVIFTLSIELLGAVFIFYSLNDIPDIYDRLFFSIFHSVASFCNAGFTTISGDVQIQGFRHDYGLQWIIMFLIVLGGLGYNIVFNFFQYIKKAFIKLLHIKKPDLNVRIITLNTKITIYTTFSLLFIGFVFLFFSEYNNTLTDHPTLFGKITAAAFHSVTPRSGGFAIVDYTQITIPSLLFIIFLMWVGASPASTGGGIKTSTFAIALLNIIAIARGKNKIELGGRQIPDESTKRAFAIIFISLIVIGISILLILLIEPNETNPLAVIFECFSAYSTVGLSMNFTPTMSEPSKYVIILVMLIGRIGMLNLMIGLMRRLHHQFYQYPEENILIN